MSATFKHRLLVWLWDFTNAFVMGAAGAGGAAGLGHAVGALPFSWRQLGSVALVAGVLSAFNYARTHRLPVIDESP